MGKFSDYVGSIKEQTELLRMNLTQATGQDCSGKSIAQCADVVSDYISESEVSEDVYVRPSWYPDIEEIISNAPDIIVSGTTYRPLYILLLADTEATTPFYQSNSTTSTARNYNRGIGGDAVLCSDDCNKDIANASAETLQVGSTIEHTWDVTKDYVDPTGQDYSVRWAIIYSSTRLDVMYSSCYFSGYCPVVECVIHQGTFASIDNVQISSQRPIDLLKYMKVCESVKSASNLQYFMAFRRQLIEVEIDADVTFGQNSFYQLPTIKAITIKNANFYTSTQQNSLATCQNLKKLDIVNSTITQLNANITTMWNLKSLDISNITNIANSISACASLNSVILSNNLTSISGGFTECFNLKYIKIPSSLQSWTGTSSATLGFTAYVELFNDFNISGINFTGSYATKDLKWFKDLCVWLKDKTGETANTMVLGTTNLSIMNNIYLTYNPNDINDITFDGVTSSTTGAMSITDYITNVKNWTLS